MRYLEIINAQGRRLASLLDDFLNLQKLEEGRLELATELVDIARRSCASRRSSSPSRATGTTLELRLARTPLPVHGDPDRLAQVVGNLLSNAIKYSPSGGIVEIVGERENGNVCGSACATRGVGIPEDQRDRIFTKFFRGNAAASGIAGSGLGLAFARAVIEAHGGPISFTSESGQGIGVPRSSCRPSRRGREGARPIAAERRLRWTGRGGSSSSCCASCSWWAWELRRVPAVDAAGTVRVIARRRVRRRRRRPAWGGAPAMPQLMTSLLYNTRVTPKSIGQFELVCTFVRGDSRICRGTIHLPEGRHRRRRLDQAPGALRARRARRHGPLRQRARHADGDPPRHEAGPRPPPRPPAGLGTARVSAARRRRGPRPRSVRRAAPSRSSSRPWPSRDAAAGRRSRARAGPGGRSARARRRRGPRRRSRRLAARRRGRPRRRPARASC